MCSVAAIILLATIVRGHDKDSMHKVVDKLADSLANRALEACSLDKVILDNATLAKIHAGTCRSGTSCAIHRPLSRKTAGPDQAHRVIPGLPLVSRPALIGLPLLGGFPAALHGRQSHPHPSTQAALSDGPAEVARKFFMDARGKQQPSEKLDSLVSDLLNIESATEIGTKQRLDQLSQTYGAGKWQVKYAPHMSTLEKVLGATFDVYYTIEEDGTITSNVAFVGPFGVKGWLNTKGKWGSEAETEKEKAQSSIRFDEIWTDFNTVEEGPSSPDDKSQHVLPDFVQPIGKAGFIEEFSKFPVEFLDDSIIIFVFKTTGTKILATKILPGA